MNRDPILARGGDVLVVDDQEENRELVEELLDAAGYRVRMAVDGESALAEVERELPDCVVLDVMMPRLDGFTVCATLKADPRTQFLPVIALTAHAMRGDRERFLAGGCDGYISKPISTRTFVADVRKHLGPRGA